MEPAEIERDVRAGRVARLIENAERASGIAARRFAIETLARAMSLADPGAVSPAERARALELGVEPAAVATSAEDPPPHAVRVPLFDPVSEESFVRMFWVEYDPIGRGTSRALGDPDVLGEALAAAATRCPPPRAQDRFRWTAARPRAFDGAEIEGDSMQAAVVASAVSLWSGRISRSSIAITGALGAGGVLIRPGAIARKVIAASGAACSAIVLPEAGANEARVAAAGRIEVIGVTTLSELLERVLEPEPRDPDPDREMLSARAAFSEGWRGYRWPAIAERLARVLAIIPAGRPELRIEALARLGAAHRHLGDVGSSVRSLEAAEAIAAARPEEVPDLPLTLLAQQRAMTELKRFRAKEAARAAATAVRVARRGRLRIELLKARGCVGLVALARGKLAAAKESFEEALALSIEHAPADTARSRMYLLDVLGLLGDLDGARAQWLAAIAEVERDSVSRRARKEPWVRAGWAAALLGMGRPEEAREVLDAGAVHESLATAPMPGLRLRRTLATALVQTGQVDRGLHLLASSPTAYGRSLEPGLRALAFLNVIAEAELRAPIGRLDDDARTRTLEAIDQLPPYGEHVLGPLKERARRALTHDGEKAAEHLRAILDACRGL